MKKYIVPVIMMVLVIAVTTSCKKALEEAKNIFPEQTADLPEVTSILDTLNTVKLPVYDSVTGTTHDTIVSIPLGVDYPLPRVVQHFNMDSIVKVSTGNVFGAGDITSVKVKQFVVKIKEGSGTYEGNINNNLSNFGKASFQFSSNTKTTPIQVASYTFPMSTSYSETVSGDGTPELRSYLDGTELYYDITANLRKHTTKKLKISIIATITMK